MPSITPRLLAIAKDARCNVFVESGTFKGNSLRRAINSGIFERNYSVEIDSYLFENIKSEFSHPDRCVFLGRSYDQFAKNIFPLCSENDRIFFWLDGHFSAGKTGGRDNPCPILDELRIIRESCPTRSMVIAIDDTDDLGRIDPSLAGNNWPTRKEIETEIERISPSFTCIDFTGQDDMPKINRGTLIYSTEPQTLLLRTGYWYVMLVTQHYLQAGLRKIKKLRIENHRE